MTVLAEGPRTNAAAKAARPSHEGAGRKLVYILSPSYSGSTLLTMLLARHPDTATIGELKAQAMGDVDQYVCSCHQKIAACPFWAAVGEGLRERGQEFDLGHFGTHFRAAGSPVADRLIRASVRGRTFETVRNLGLLALPSCQSALGRVLERNRVLIETILELQGGRIFLDGSKDVVRLKHLLDAGLWRIKVIHLVRDGRGAANSYMRHYGVDMTTAAKEWKHAQREARRLLARLPRQSWMMVRYEDLCCRPDAVVGEILEFLGCPPLDGPLLPVNGGHHILGNRMRLKPLDSVRLDEKWRERLTGSDLKAFAKIAGKANARLGYE